MEVICEYDAILNEGLEHARILVSEGVLEPAPCACPGPTAVIWWEQEVRVLVTLWYLV